MRILALLYFVFQLSFFAKADDSLSQEQLLKLGDTALASDDLATAIGYYERGINTIKNDESISTSLSLYTNLATAHSSTGNEENAANMYRTAIKYYLKKSDEIVEQSARKEATDIAAQASFFLGMTLQELEQNQKAADAYAFANTLDPNHWSSLANLGSVLQDHLNQPAEAMTVYYKAYDILSLSEVEPTDPPENPKQILSQLQYRIGLAINFAEEQKCVMREDPDNEVPCSEMAANAFNTAVTLDPNNEEAKHMLASVTTDATMSRASNTYVTELFERYAENFEHSLVEELGYDGFQRLRLVFDRVFGESTVPTFEVVIDAGCGTGLAGEQFRNISNSLVGIDLSPSIILEAEKMRPNLYDLTKVGDFMEIFRSMKPISLIIAADSYIYFGDLVPLFQSMKDGLADGGIVAFTLENVSEEDEKRLTEMKPDWKWQLTPSGRFAHRYEYVKAVGEGNMLTVIRYEQMDGFRKEGSGDVRGHVFVMQKEAKDEL